MQIGGRQRFECKEIGGECKITEQAMVSQNIPKSHDRELPICPSELLISKMNPQNVRWILGLILDLGSSVGQMGTYVLRLRCILGHPGASLLIGSKIWVCRIWRGTNSHDRVCMFPRCMSEFSFQICTEPPPVRGGPLLRTGFTILSTKAFRWVGGSEEGAQKNCKCGKTRPLLFSLGKGFQCNMLALGLYYCNS